MVSVTSLEGFDPMDIFNSKKEFKDWLLSHIDLTNLSPYMSDEKLKEFLDKANNYGFKRVCIPITAVKKSDTSIPSIISKPNSVPTLKD